ncbi:MAG: TonB-dependent receptor [Flammeovirgaceae bacterium]
MNKLASVTLCFLLLMFALGDIKGQSKYTLSGYITDDETGETLIGATVQVKGTSLGAVANLYGFYSITLPEGNYKLQISYTGFESQEFDLQLTKNIEKNFRIKPESSLIEEVVITAEKEDQNISENNLGLSKLSAKTIESIPAIGEADIIRVIKLLPGVQTTSETSSGFSVRGGGPDQNLILLDEAVVYNPSHLLGFFSTFNNDAIKNVQLYKGYMPAKYGGRLSSVLDIRMKEGNNQKFSASGGISPIAARATLEMPIVKDKGSVILSGRRTYADAIAKLGNNENVDNSTLFFYDLNLKANYTLSQKDRVFVSGYFGKDVFGIKDDFELDFRWGNMTSTARWNHVFSSKLFANTSFIYSRYNYRLGTGDNDFRFTWDATLTDYTVKTDFDWFLHEKHNLTFGFSSTYHQIDPGKVTVKAGEATEATTKITRANSLEHSVYISNEHEVSDRFTLNYGGRLALFQNIGPGVQYVYNNFERTDSIPRKKGEIYHSYLRFEPRVAANYRINAVSSIKGSYVRAHQFLQLASNSLGGTPLDVWFQASPNVEPQVADQFSLGYFRNFANNKIETSIEAYYKYIDHQIDFRDHAELLLNEELENELRFGTASSYGVELLVKKPIGKLTGWFSFTWSNTFRKIQGVNRGERYRSNYDRPINISIVGNYKISERVSISSNWVYYSGLPFTTPSGRFTYGNVIVPSYTGRNGDRMPDYHRMDIGVTLQQKKNKTAKVKGSWNFSVYNLYGRQNANIITFRPNEDNPTQTEAVQYTVFRWVPTIAYNFNF